MKKFIMTLVISVICLAAHAEVGMISQNSAIAAESITRSIEDASIKMEQIQQEKIAGPAKLKKLCEADIILANQILVMSEDSREAKLNELLVKAKVLAQQDLNLCKNQEMAFENMESIFMNIEIFPDILHAIIAVPESFKEVELGKISEEKRAEQIQLPLNAISALLN